jgi:hypothetical protein
MSGDEVAGQQNDHSVAVLWGLNHCSFAHLTEGEIPMAISRNYREVI